MSISFVGSGATGARHPAGGIHVSRELRAEKGVSVGIPNKPAREPRHKVSQPGLGQASPGLLLDRL
jgi:hypothetical protein